MQQDSFLTVDILDPKNFDYRVVFEKYLSSILEKNQGERLLRNYAPDRFKLEDQISVLVVFDRKSSKIFGFSSIYRPPHWPEGMVRVGNRTWIDQDFRSNVENNSKPTRSSALKSAIKFVDLVFSAHSEIAQTKSLKLCVITRESKGHITSVLPLFASKIEQGGQAWKADHTGYYQTVPNGMTKGCWQKILYTEVEPGARSLLSQVPRTTADVYAQRYVAENTSFLSKN